MKLRPLPLTIALAALAGTVALISLRWNDVSKHGDAGKSASEGASTSAVNVSNQPGAHPGAWNLVRPDGTGAEADKMTAELKAEVDRISATLAAMPPIQPGEVENEEALELLRRWAAIDPASAIQYAARHPELHGKATLPADLLTLWLDQKGERAMQWVMTLPKGELRSLLLPSVISLIAERDPKTALQMAGDLAGDARSSALSALFTEWASVDPRAAVEQAGELATEKERNQAMRDVLGKWADVDLNAAVEWAKKLPVSPDPGSVDIFPAVLEAVLEKWTAQAPRDVAQYIVSTPAGPRRIQMLSAVAGQWAVEDPKAAIAWASKVTAEADRDVFVRGVLAGVAQSNVQSAADLVLTLPSGTAQKQGMEMILGQWTAGNPAEVAAWAATQFQNEQRGAQLGTIVAAWAGSEPKSLGNWLNSLPQGNSRDVCCAALARHLATTYPDIATEWAQSIANPQMRQQQLDAVHRLSGVPNLK